MTKWNNSAMIKITQLTVTCLKSTTVTLEKGRKYV